MTIDLFNKNVPDAQFKICWGAEQCTPIFSLDPGGSGRYDLTYSHHISLGTQCHVYAWSATTERFNCGITFTYRHMADEDAVFNYAINTTTRQAIFKLIGKL